MIPLDRKHLPIYAVAMATIAMLSFLFPNTLRFKYEYEEGKIWRYDNLIAPFDFGILKPDKTLQQEYATIDSLFASHYLKDPNLVDTVLLSFEEAFNKMLTGLDVEQYKPVRSNAQTYLNFGKSILKKYYTTGIFNLDSLAEPRDAEQMTILEDNKLRIIHPLSLQDAYDLMKRDLANSPLEFSSLLYPLLSRMIQPNIHYDRERTNRLRKLEKDKIAITRGKISNGELIVSKDAVLTPELVQRLDSYRYAHAVQVSRDKSHWLVWVGYLLLLTLLIGLFVYSIQEDSSITSLMLKRQIFLALWIVVLTYITYLVDLNGTLSLYIIPYCIAPIVVKTFFDSRTAFYTHVITIMTIALTMSLGFEFILIQLVAGLVAMVSNKVTRYWTPFFRSILLIGLAYALSYFGLTIIKEGSVSAMDWKNYIWFVTNIMLVMLAYPLVPLLERVFGFTSAITLAELGDMNKPLLKKLSLQAPGTFQHSLQVANIAEAAAEAIGADSLLLRVAALYHDIGKMNEPEIFIENQGTYDPHSSLTAEESARKIIDHVTEGAALAKKNRLPKAIIEMIKTHHGTTRVEYFYKVKADKDELKLSDDASFRYPGPKPTTREEVILMMADSIEAACKSLKNPTESDINSMVDHIIAGKEASNQLSESSLSYHEMEKARASFKKVLKGIYHVRIEYPKDHPAPVQSRD